MLQRQVSVTLHRMTFAIAFAAYTAVIIGIGVFSARYARRSDEDYFLAGRSLGPWVASLSASASSESGWVTIGLVGWAFQSGVSAYWIIPGCLVGFFFNWFVIAPRLCDRARYVNALTIPDFFAYSFGERLPVLRLLSVVVILTAMWLYVAAQFAAAGTAFSAAFEQVDYFTGVLLGAGIVLAYVVLGGFRAACWTDFLQGLIMVGTLVIFPLWLVLIHGGFDFLLPALESADPALTRFVPERSGLALVGFLLGSGALGINFGYPGQPHVLVRFMALRERRFARIGGIVAMSWGALVLWGAVTIGLLLRALVSDAANMESWLAPMDADLAAGASNAGETGLVLAAKNLLPGVFSGMVLAAVLAAICSTADSQLVVAASSGANDVYARLIDHSRRAAHLVVNRTIVAALGIGAVLLVIDREVQVYTYVLTYGWAVLGASFGPQLILLLLWRRATYAGCIAGMITGFATALIWPQVYDAKATGVEAYNLVVAFNAALVVNLLVSFATTPSAAAKR